MPLQTIEASWDEWDAVVSQMDRGSPPPQIVRGERRSTLSLEVGEAHAILDALKAGDPTARAAVVELLETKVREHRRP